MKEGYLQIYENPFGELAKYTETPCGRQSSC